MIGHKIPLAYWCNEHHKSCRVEFGWSIWNNPTIFQRSFWLAYMLFAYFSNSLGHYKAEYLSLKGIALYSMPRRDTSTKSLRKEGLMPTWHGTICRNSLKQFCWSEIRWRMSGIFCTFPEVQGLSRSTVRFIKLQLMLLFLGKSCITLTVSARTLSIAIIAWGLKTVVV